MHDDIMKGFIFPHLSLFQRFLLTSAFLAVIIVACGAGYWWMYASIGGFSGSLDAIAEKIASREQDRVKANHVGTTLKKRASELARINGLFVSKTQPVNFIEDLEAIGRATGSDVKVAANEAGDSTDMLVFHLTASGSSSGLRRMVRLIELMPYEVVIDDVSYQTGGIATGGNGLSVAPGPLLGATLAATLRVKTLAAGK